MHQIEQSIDQGIEGGHAQGKSIHVGVRQDEQEQKHRRHKAVGQPVIGRGEQPQRVEVEDDPASFKGNR